MDINLFANVVHGWPSDGSKYNTVDIEFGDALANLVEGIFWNTKNYKSSSCLPCVNENQLELILFLSIYFAQESIFN